MVSCDFVQLVFGNSGVLQGIHAGKAYVDMSTVDVETMADVFEVLCETLLGSCCYCDSVLTTDEPVEHGGEQTI